MFLHYYKTISKINFPLAFLLTLLSFIGGTVGQDSWAFLPLQLFTTFLLLYCTASLFLALFFYELRRSERYYFYYNAGLSKLQLIGYTVAINFGLYFLFKFIVPLVI